MIIKAAQYAFLAHSGQFRKYTNRPYIEHPMRVAGRVALLPEVNEYVVAAAWLHDVIEDCGKTYADIARQFNHIVAHFVRELTNPSKNRPDLNRAKRKELDRDHIAKCSRWARIIKLVDRIDNLGEMAGSDPDFLKLYVKESLALAPALYEADDPVIRPLHDHLLVQTEIALLQGNS